jgi:hypothetical protein
VRERLFVGPTLSTLAVLELPEVVELPTLSAAISR